MINHEIHDYSVISETPLALFVPTDVLEPLRLDVNYYRPHFVEAAARIQHTGIPLVSIDRLRDPGQPITDGIRQHNKTERGILLIRTQNLGEPTLDLANRVYVDIGQHNTAGKSAVRTGDLLVAIRGYLGKAALINDIDSPANINQHIARISVNPAQANTAYLWAFFSSRIGTTLLERQVTGTVQQGVTLPAFREFSIPLPPRQIQDYIGAKVKLAEQCKLEALLQEKRIKEKFATILPLDDIILDNTRIFWTSPDEVITRWLSVNYYLPQYFSLQRYLQKKGVAFVTLSSVAECLKKKDRPRSGYIRYIEIGDIDTSLGIINSESIYKTEEVPNNAQRLVEEGDILVSTRRPNRGAVGIVSKEQNGSYASVFLARLKAKKGNNPYFIQQYLRSTVGRLFLEQRCTETTYPVISEDDLMTVPIPLVSTDTQMEIGKDFLRYSILVMLANKFIEQVKLEIESLIEGRLDSNAILTRRQTALTWESIQRDLEAQFTNE